MMHRWPCEQQPCPKCDDVNQQYVDFLGAMSEGDGPEPEDGTVLLDAEGHAWQRRDRYWYHAGNGGIALTWGLLWLMGPFQILRKEQNHGDVVSG